MPHPAPEAMTDILTGISHLAASIAVDPSTSNNLPEHLKLRSLEHIISKEVGVFDDLVHRIDSMGGSIELLSKRHRMEYVSSTTNHIS